MGRVLAVVGERLVLIHELACSCDCRLRVVAGNRCAPVDDRVPAIQQVSADAIRQCHAEVLGEVQARPEHSGAFYKRLDYLRGSFGRKAIGESGGQRDFRGRCRVDDRKARIAGSRSSPGGREQCSRQRRLVAGVGVRQDMLPLPPRHAPGSLAVVEVVGPDFLGVPLVCPPGLALDREVVQETGRTACDH